MKAREIGETDAEQNNIALSLGRWARLSCKL